MSAIGLVVDLVQYLVVHSDFCCPSWGRLVEYHVCEDLDSFLCKVSDAVVAVVDPYVVFPVRVSRDGGVFHVGFMPMCADVNVVVVTVAVVYTCNLVAW